jgi:GDSL/SGNH-like Acyl-Esterase family found in Pmr5 and Cas1p
MCVHHDGVLPVAAGAGGARMKGGVAARILLLQIVLLLVGGGVLTQTSTLLVPGSDISRNEIATRPENGSNVEPLRIHTAFPIAMAVKNYSTNETCVTPEMIGAWTYVDTPNFTNSHCCSPRDEYPRDHPFCDYNPKEVVELAREVHDAVDFQGNTAHLPWMQGQGCASNCRATFRDHYVWMSPNLPSWDAAEFCHLLGPSRRILMMGDSTMGQAAATLISAVHGFCQTQLFYFIADTLIKEPYGQNRGSHWLDVVGNHSRTADSDIVVLTVGAHLANTEMNNVSEVVMQQIMAMKQKRPSLTILYKTQQPGGCTSEIANVSLSPLEVGKKFVSYAEHEYNHAHFYEYDKTVIRRLQELDIPFLDMRMLYSRSDAHPSSKLPECRNTSYCDCLHFCSPGPLDTFAILFLQLLRNNFAVSQCV